MWECITTERWNTKTAVLCPLFHGQGPFCPADADVYLCSSSAWVNRRGEAGGRPRVCLVAINKCIVLQLTFNAAENRQWFHLINVDSIAELQEHLSRNTEFLHHRAACDCCLVLPTAEAHQLPLAQGPASVFSFHSFNFPGQRHWAAKPLWDLVEGEIKKKKTISSKSLKTLCVLHWVEGGQVLERWRRARKSQIFCWPGLLQRSLSGYIFWYLPDLTCLPTLCMWHCQISNLLSSWQSPLELEVTRLGWRRCRWGACVPWLWKCSLATHGDGQRFWIIQAE